MLSDAHFLAVAHIIADAGTCSRLHVGAVLVYARRIVSTGYNGAPSGMPHCDHTPPRDEFDRQLTKDKPCTIAVHAEVNAIAFAAKSGVSTDGSVLYTTDSPCAACAQLVINAGIKEVKYGKRYRDPSGLELLERGGVRTEELGEPGLHIVSITPGDPKGVHSGQSADTAFEQGWSEYAAARRRGGTGQ